MSTLATALLAGLKDHGAREIFGIPGDFVLPLYKAIEDSRILPHYTLSHEPAVGFAADAAARYHQGLGVAVVTYGAGAFNVVNAIAGAYAERSPVVVIAGAPGARAGSSSTAWSQVISRITASWVSMVRAWWCSRKPPARSRAPGAPAITTTGERSA